jgi:hypothetical protein
VGYTSTSDTEDVAQIFIDRIETNVKDLYNKFLRFPKKMTFTKTDETVYNDSTVCHICGAANFDQSEDNVKVRDHCHIMVKFRGRPITSAIYNLKILNSFQLFFIIYPDMTVISLLRN